MQETYSNQFYKEWKSGFEMYLEGNWEKALPQLKLASSLGPNGFDGPSASLITFI
jgi:protein involved in temperature-dependent protein secretion